MMPSFNATIKRQVTAFVRGQGFDKIGFCKAELDARSQARLKRFVAGGEYGDMEWLATSLSRRLSPKAMWNDARSAIIVATNYGPDCDPMASLQHRDRGVISVYAHGDDYHLLMKKRLKHIARTIMDEFGIQVRVFVDTAPLMEKPLAQLAGLGWQGKHTNLVATDAGNWLFLGVLLTDLEPDPAMLRAAPASDHCGSCVRCIDICPTGAITRPYHLDARACISYLTIEHKGSIPHRYRRAIGNRIFGCDDCLAICPWNKFAHASHEQRLKMRSEYQPLMLDRLLMLNDTDFRTLFRKSPIKRTGFVRFMRNVLIAAGNSDRPDLIQRVEPFLHHDSPIIGGAAIWALSRLLPSPAFRTRAEAALPHCDDPELRMEWKRGMDLAQEAC